MGSRARIVAPHTAQNPRRFSASLGVRWLCHRFRTAQIQRSSYAPSGQRSSPLPRRAPRKKVCRDRHPEPREGSAVYDRTARSLAKSIVPPRIAAAEHRSQHGGAESQPPLACGFVRARLQPLQSHFTEGRGFNPAKKRRRAAPTARRPFRRAFTPPRHRRASRKKMWWGCHPEPREGSAVYDGKCAFTREVDRPPKESTGTNMAANSACAHARRNLNRRPRAVSSGHAFSRTNFTSPRGGVSTPPKNIGAQRPPLGGLFAEPSQIRRLRFSSGHGFNRAHHIGAQRLPLGGLFAEPSQDSPARPQFPISIFRRGTRSTFFCRRRRTTQWIWSSSPRFRPRPPLYSGRPAPRSPAAALRPCSRSTPSTPTAAPLPLFRSRSPPNPSSPD